MLDLTSSAGYLEWIGKRFDNQGYRRMLNVTGAAGDFLCVAHRSRFELAKFGMEEVFFVFAEFSNLDGDGLLAFSRRAFRHALASKTVPLPCGFFEAVACYSVALVTGEATAAIAAVRTTPPPKHWAKFELPVVYDLNAGRAYCYEGTPLWGAFYYEGFRKTAQEMLRPSQA